MTKIELTHNTAIANQIKLHYVRAGTGEQAIVLLHGSPKTWYEWRLIIPTLAQTYTVIAPDFRGFGDSDKPTSGYDKKTVAEDIHQLVQQLGFSSIYLVGHDIGSTVAYAYASLYPHEVEKLVFLDVPPLGIGSPEWAPNLWHMQFHMTPNLPEALLAGKIRTYLEWFYGDGWMHGTPKPLTISEADLDEYVRTYNQPGAIASWLAHYRAFPQDIEDNSEFVKTKLTMPILTIGGEQTLGDWAYKVMSVAAESVQGVLVKNCGHWIPEERPDELLQYLTTFFESV
ncbi:MAG: alpha/beta hydrolase [Cyanobacteria bacterium P01_E01_bin.35]